jgi:hypothetical protein
MGAMFIQFIVLICSIFLFLLSPKMESRFWGVLWMLQALLTINLIFAIVRSEDGIDLGIGALVMVIIALSYFFKAVKVRFYSLIIFALLYGVFTLPWEYIGELSLVIGPLWMIVWRKKFLRSQS